MDYLIIKVETLWGKIK